MAMRKSVLIVAVGTLLGVGAVAAVSATGERGRMGGPMQLGGWGGDWFGGKWRRHHMPRTQEEFDAQTRERFARLDRNGDGFIDASEIEANISQRMGERGKRHDRMGERLLRRVDADHDGKVTKDEFTTAIRNRFADLDLNNDGRITDDDLSPMLRGRGVLTDESRVRGGRRFALLREADANKDGVITRDEALAAAEQRFARLDRNKDGAIDSADRDTLRKEMADYRVRRFIHRYGADAEGKVSRDQFYAKAKERFARLDLNNDGTIARDEWPGRNRGWHGRGWHGRGEPADQGGDAPASRQGDETKRN